LITVLLVDKLKLAIIMKGGY